MRAYWEKLSDRVSALEAQTFRLQRNMALESEAQAATQYVLARESEGQTPSSTYWRDAGRPIRLTHVFGWPPTP